MGAFVKKAAEGIGFRACAVQSVTAFRAAMAADPPDEIVLDLHLGIEDGVEVLRHLAAEGCRARITISSGFDKRVLESAQQLARGLGLNVGEALNKPIRLAALRFALGAAVAKAAPIAEEDLRRAINSGELLLEFQPIVSLRPERSVRGAEALVRWQPPNSQRIPPDQFIPVAEANPELMDQLTLEVARQAAQATRTLRRSGFDIPLSVNVSASNLGTLDFPERLAAVFREAHVPHAGVTLEVTETAAMSHPLVSLDVLVRLRLQGFRLAVDDFGTGYTSIAMLRQLPYSEMKIDRSFVGRMLESNDALAVVAAAVSLAQTMGLETVAEGVESAAALEKLTALGAAAAQGYHIARPMSLDKLLPWLHSTLKSSLIGLRTT